MFLPEHKYEGAFNDDSFIEEQLNMIPWQWQRGAVNKYSKVFKEEGRTKANLWLLRGVKEHGNKL
jgi:hypothetical protein